MTHILHFQLESPRAQLIMLLLAVLQGRRGFLRKQEVLSHIESNHWFEISDRDRSPYRSQSEPRWHTLLAWARKDAVDGKLFENNDKDQWELSLDGRNSFIHARQAFRDKHCLVSACFFWSRDFKHFIDHEYQPSSADVSRPQYLYEDELPPWMCSTRGSAESRRLDRILRQIGIKPQK
jgi:hypothetical protein